MSWIIGVKAIIDYLLFMKNEAPKLHHTLFSYSQMHELGEVCTFFMLTTIFTTNCGINEWKSAKFPQSVDQWMPKYCGLGVLAPHLFVDSPKSTVHFVTLSSFELDTSYLLKGNCQTLVWGIALRNLPIPWMTHTVHCPGNHEGTIENLAWWR